MINSLGTLTLNLNPLWEKNSGVGVEIICANFGEDYKNVSVQNHPVSKNWKKV